MHQITRFMDSSDCKILWSLISSEEINGCFFLFCFCLFVVFLYVGITWKNDKSETCIFSWIWIFDMPSHNKTFCNFRGEGDMKLNCKFSFFSWDSFNKGAITSLLYLKYTEKCKTKTIWLRNNSKILAASKLCCKDIYFTSWKYCQ